MVISEQEWHRTLLLARRTQEVGVDGDVEGVIVYPDGSSAEEIERMILAHRSRQGE